jgi:arabinoxylan arabinofuranohydrolase
VTVGGVQDGATYGDSGTRTVSWTASDAVSGVAGTMATLEGAAIVSGAQLRLWQLDLGEHVLIVTATDGAGNETARRVAFTVTTSVTDLNALIDRFRAEGRLSKGAAAALRSQLAEVEAALAAGDTDGAVRSLEQFLTLARIQVKDRPVRTLLERDGRALIAALEA